jgi:hypothetical protein
MLQAVPGPGALVSYIQTGDRDARIAYRKLPDRDRLAYRDLVNRVYDTAIAHHFGEHPSEERVHDLIDRLADRHPQYAGGVRRVLGALVEGRPRGGMTPRQLLTAQHLVIREIAKLHRGFRERADRIVAQGDDEALAAAETFTGRDAASVVSVTLALDGSMRGLELQRGVERMGGRSIGTSIVRAWVDAEQQRWARARALRLHDSFPEIGTGAGRGDTFRCEAYSASRLCRATVDRYGRLRGITFMRTRLFGDDGRHGLAAQLREAITGAQQLLADAW